MECPTVESLLWELEALEQALDGEEREDTWERFERGILRFAAVTRGGAHKFAAVYIEGMGVKGLGPKVVECMLSDRGRLSGVATDFLTSMAPRLGLQFSSLIPLYIPPTIRLLARPNKVYLRRAEKCLVTIVTHCPLPSLIPLIKCGIEDKNEACRRSCGGALEKILKEWEKDLIGARGVAELEVAMKRMATEKDAEVRKIGKRMWEHYSAKWPERMEEQVVCHFKTRYWADLDALLARRFTAPLTPTIKKYLDISQSKTSTSRTLFNAPAVRVKHPLSQMTTASAESSTMNRPTMASRQGSASTSANKDRNMQAIRGLGRSISSENASGPSGTNGMKPFLLRSTSAMVPSSSAGPRAGINRSVSTANVFGSRQPEDEDDESTDTASTTSATRPRVIAHASTPELTGATIIRSHAQRGAAGTLTTSRPAMRARIVSGLSQVTEGKSSSSTGIGLGRPQGAVRPTGRVLSSSATIGIGSRSASLTAVPTHSGAVKPRTLVTSVVDQRGPIPPTASNPPVKTHSDDVQVADQLGEDAKSVEEAKVKRTTVGTKTITTNPGGTTKTRQFFRPTPSNTASTTSVALHASTNSNASTVEGRPGRIVSRTASTGRSGGLTAPTASSGAKVVHRLLADHLHPQTTGASAGGASTKDSTTTSSQQPQAKLVVSPRKPRQKLKPPVPAFMPTSRTRVLKDGKAASSSVALSGGRPKVKPSALAKAVGVEPASIPLPASPARKAVTSRTGERERVDPVPATTSVSTSPTVTDEIAAIAALVPLPPSPKAASVSLPEDAQVENAIESVSEVLPQDVQPAKGIDATLSSAHDAPPAQRDHISLSQIVAPAILADGGTTVAEGDIPNDGVTFKNKDDQRLRESLARASTSRALANEQNVPPAPLEVNLIDLDDPEDVVKPFSTVNSPVKRMPLGPASPNQTAMRKISTPKTTSPKVKQLQDFFEKKAFSPSPSPEHQPRLMTITHRTSTTPVSTPPRPRVLS